MWAVLVLELEKWTGQSHPIGKTNLPQKLQDNVTALGTEYWRNMERIHSNCSEWLVTYSDFQQTFIEHQLCAECCALAFIYVLTVILGAYWLHFTNYVSGMIPSDMVSFVWIIPPPNNPVESVCTFATSFIFVMWRTENWAELLEVRLYRVWQDRVFFRILWRLKTKGDLGTILWRALCGIV